MILLQTRLYLWLQIEIGLVHPTTAPKVIVELSSNLLNAQQSIRSDPRGAKKEMEFRSASSPSMISKS